MPGRYGLPRFLFLAVYASTGVDFFPGEVYTVGRKITRGG